MLTCKTPSCDCRDKHTSILLQPVIEKVKRKIYFCPACYRPISGYPTEFDDFFEESILAEHLGEVIPIMEKAGFLPRVDPFVFFQAFKNYMSFKDGYPLYRTYCAKNVTRGTFKHKQNKNMQGGVRCLQNIGFMGDDDTPVFAVNSLRNAVAIRYYWYLNTGQLATIIQIEASWRYDRPYKLRLYGNPVYIIGSTFFIKHADKDEYDRACIVDGGILAEPIYEQLKLIINGEVDEDPSLHDTPGVSTISYREPCNYKSDIFSRIKKPAVHYKTNKGIMQKLSKGKR